MYHSSAQEDYHLMGDKPNIVKQLKVVDSEKIMISYKCKYCSGHRREGRKDSGETTEESLLEFNI